jgi:CrcB protein
MLLYVLAALGGALGAVLRYAVGRFVQDVLDRPWFPYNTLFINVTGCFVFGLIMGWVEAGRSLTPEQRTFMLVGILGGYTTFSTFGFETFALLRDGQIVPALLNVGLQCVLGIVGVWLGMGLARVV